MKIRIHLRTAMLLVIIAALLFALIIRERQARQREAMRRALLETEAQTSIHEASRT